MNIALRNCYTYVSVILIVQKSNGLNYEVTLVQHIWKIYNATKLKSMLSAHKKDGIEWLVII